MLGAAGAAAAAAAAAAADAAAAAAAACRFFSRLLTRGCPSSSRPSAPPTAPLPTPGATWRSGCGSAPVAGPAGCVCGNPCAGAGREAPHALDEAAATGGGGASAGPLPSAGASCGKKSRMDSPRDGSRARPPPAAVDGPAEEAERAPPPRLGSSCDALLPVPPPWAAGVNPALERPPASGRNP